MTWFNEAPPYIAPPDAVNPAHYRDRFQGVEVIQLTRHLNFNRGNAVKYLARAGAKASADEKEDLRKVLWYVIDELQCLGVTAEELRESIKAHAGLK